MRRVAALDRPTRDGDRRPIGLVVVARLVVALAAAGAGRVVVAVQWPEVLC